MTPDGIFFTSAAKSRDAHKANLNFSTGNRLSEAWLDRLVKHSIENSTEAAFAAYLLAWTKGDFSACIQRNSVLVMVGEHDAARTVDVTRGTYLQWYRNAKFEVMTNAGHYLMDETPVALATTIERFLGT